MVIFVLQTASILFVDAPVGTGFSFALTPDGFATSDTLAAREIYQFLKKVSQETISNIF